MKSASPRKRQKVQSSTYNTNTEPKLLLQLSTLLSTREFEEPNSDHCLASDLECHEVSKVQGHYHLLSEFVNPDNLFVKDSLWPWPSKASKKSVGNVGMYSLLNYGTDVNMGICNAGLTLLHHSLSNQRGQTSCDEGIEQGQIGANVFEFLMAVGLDVNIMNEDMSSCNYLHRAIPISTRCEDKESLELKQALRGLHECLLKLLMNDEAAVNCREEDFDPLHLSAFQSHFKIVKNLMKFGMDTNSNSGGGGLHKPAVVSNAILESVGDSGQCQEKSHGERDLARLLMTSGSEVNSLFEKQRPLFYHFNHQLLHSVELLLFNGAGVNCYDKRGEPLFYELKNTL